MGQQRFEVESEAWYRAVAEGRVGAVSDRNAGVPTPAPPHPQALTAAPRPPAR
jgi:hypothetical protein